MFGLVFSDLFSFRSELLSQRMCVPTQIIVLLPKRGLLSREAVKREQLELRWRGRARLAWAG